AAKQDWVRAESDRTNALTFDKRHAETSVLPAAARNAQANKMGYKDDADAALKLDPHHAEALVESGNIKLPATDVPGARADWLDVIGRAGNTPAGDAARMHIQDLEVRNR